MIKVFGAADKDYTSNGDIVIRPLKAVVHNEDNGDFYLDLEAGLEYDDFLIGGNIIVAPTPQGEQAFRIINPQKTRRKITLKAYHVFYDTNNFLIYDSYVVNKDCNDALDHLNSATDTESPFTMQSDVDTVESYRCVRTSLNEAIGVVLERWGGHLVRDNWDIQIRREIGRDNGITVRYAKNLQEITYTENWDNVVTKLLPTGTDGITLNALDSSIDPYLYASNTYQIPYTKTVSFEQNINADDYKDAEGNTDETAYKTALINDLREQATQYLAKNCIPEINYVLKASIDHVVDIGDTIEVIDERIGIDILTNVISYDYNALLNKYSSLEFGNYREKQLSNLVSNITAGAVEKAASISDAAVADINNKLTGSYVINNGQSMYIVDTLPKENATNVFRVDKNGLAHAGSFNGVYSYVWGIDNTLDLSKVNVINVPKDRNAATAILQTDATGFTPNTFTQLTLTQIGGVGNKLTLSNGGIKIGAGIDYIMISGHIGVESISNDGIRLLRICKNTDANMLAMTKKYLVNIVTDCPNTLDITPVIVPVTENDVIALFYNTPDGTDVISGANTSLTVEVI